MRLLLAITTIALLAALLVWRAEAKTKLEVGAPAPEFTLPNQEGKPLSLIDLRGQWVVLYFYPKDFTGGCTLEAHNFAKDEAAYQKLHAVVVGVSADTVESHKSFCAKEGLNFRLLSDVGGKTAELYESKMLGLALASRHTFIIDSEGRIAAIFRDVSPAGHSRQVLDELGRLTQEKQRPSGK